jgi:hypothetical protein
MKAKYEVKLVTNPHGTKVVLEKGTVFRLIKKSPPRFMEPEGSISASLKALKLWPKLFNEIHTTIAIQT